MHFEGFKRINIFLMEYSSHTHTDTHSNTYTERMLIYCVCNSPNMKNYFNKFSFCKIIGVVNIVFVLFQQDNWL